MGPVRDGGGHRRRARPCCGRRLDLGRDRESVDRPDDPRALTLRSVKSLVTETAGYQATQDESVDWYRHGPEIAAVLLSRRADAQTSATAG